MSWQAKKLEAVADFCLGKMLDQQKNRGEHLPYLANVNVRWGEFDLSDLREMRFEHHELERYGLKYGDIVMCEGGEPGRCAIWKDQKSSMMIQKALHRIRPNDCLKSEFLYYYFLYKGRTGHLSPLFTGATIKHLPREKLALVEVPVPPYSTQSYIASILSAYDDLIENTGGGFSFWSRRRGSYTRNGSSASASPVTNTSKSPTTSRKVGENSIG
jgi:type I restriction enzyme S subunit